MKKFVKKYIDVILIVSAVLLVGLIIWFFVSSTTAISANFSEAMSPPEKGGKDLIYNLEQAKQLDFRGLAR